ncbi:MAG: peptide chain release factor N(5)-glutamine methyltransferase [Nitrospinota bacterium]
MIGPAEGLSADTIQVLLRHATVRLSRAGLCSARLDAEILLAHTVGVGREDLIAHPEIRLDRGKRSFYLESVKRRERREPVAYITGRREFWSLELKVDRRVLIPRPETETLVSESLRRLAPLGRGRSARVMDLGTGSGNIALALASERADLFVVATDLSLDALRVARENAQRLGLSGRVVFLGADWLQALRPDESFDAVVSNPPYIREADWEALDRQTLSYEPHVALIAGWDGLGAYRTLVKDAPRVLRPGGWLVMEIGMDQAPEVRGLLEDCGAYDGIEIIQDLAGRVRVAAAERRR